MLHSLAGYDTLIIWMDFFSLLENQQNIFWLLGVTFLLLEKLSLDTKTLHVFLFLAFESMMINMDTSLQLCNIQLEKTEV